MPNSSMTKTHPVLTEQCPCFCDCGRETRFLNSETRRWECTQCALGYHQATADDYIPLPVQPPCSVCGGAARWQYATGVTTGGEPEYRCDAHPSQDARVGQRVRVVAVDATETPLAGTDTALVCARCAHNGVPDDLADGLPGVLHHPGYQMANYSVISGTRLSAEWLADQVRDGVLPDELNLMYLIPPGGLAVALWWAATRGPRRFRIWREWADEAVNHLWFGCINVGWPASIEAKNRT